jgi:uncharacterized protein (TIGR03067 family)
MARALLGMAALLSLLVLCSQTAADQGERTDNGETVLAAQLRGTWVAVSIEQAGRKEDPPKGQELTFTFEAVKVVINEGTRITEGTYITNDTKNPKEIDLIPPKDLRGGDPIKGVYRIDGDTLKLAFSRRGARPSTFDGKDNEGGVITFKRKK